MKLKADSYQPVIASRRRGNLTTPCIERGVVGIIDEMRLFIAFATIMALMAVALMPLDMALAQEANPDRTLPDTVERGESFDVTVTFIAPADKFNAIVLSDLAPDGWNVTINKTWSAPSADALKATDNNAEITWFGEIGVGFDSGTSFNVVYRVAVPDDASAGIHTFNGFLGYYFGADGPYYENITGDSEVEVPVSATPLISCSPTSCGFSATPGSTPAAVTLEIWNSGIGTISWTLSDDAEWLSESPASGSSTSEHDTIAVSVDITGMSAGDYSANITITADEASNSPRIVPISLHISSAEPQISFNPESLTFTAVEGGSTHTTETLAIWNSGIEILNWSVSDDAEWLRENPTSGSSIGEYDRVTVSVNTAGMSAGDYSAGITITADEAGNSPRIVPVSLHISEAAPQISFTPESLTFTAVEAGSTLANKTLGIWNSGIEILNWSVSDDAAWLSQNPTSGSSTSAHDTTSVTVSVNTAGMSGGDYSANITITSPGASNSPQTVPVSLHVGQIGPPPPQPWLSRYWWTIVIGIVAVVLLAYFLWRKRAA